MLLLALVFCSWLKIHFKYLRSQDDDTISLEFFFWGFINYKIEVPVLVLEQKLTQISLTTRTELETGGDSSQELMGRSSKFSIDSIQDALRMIEEWWPYLKRIRTHINNFLRHLRLERFVWRTGIGTSDAAATGLLTGIAWAFMGGATSFFYRKIASGWSPPELRVEPNFKKEGFTTYLDCIFKIRVGHIMVTGFKLLLEKPGLRQVFRRQWKL